MFATHVHVSRTPSGTTYSHVSAHTQFVEAGGPLVAASTPITAGAVALGISVDEVWCHAAFARDRSLRFPLLADFEPKGAVARTYGVYSQHDGTSERALFVSD